MEAIKSETVTSFWRKPCPDDTQDFKGFTTEAIKEIIKETVDTAKKRQGLGEQIEEVVVKRFKVQNLDKSKS